MGSFGYYAQELNGRTSRIVVRPIKLVIVVFKNGVEMERCEILFVVWLKI